MAIGSLSCNPFPDGTPETRSLEELKAGIGRNVAKRYARR